MATPRPPSQWTRVRVGGPQSQHPEEAVQLRRQRQQTREQWAAAAAVAPQVRAYKARLETEWLPSIDRDVAEAEAAVKAATARLMGRVAAEQGYEVLEQDGQPVIFLSAEDQANDPDLVLAEFRLKAVREGRRLLLEQLGAAAQHLAFVDYQQPPPED